MHVPTLGTPRLRIRPFALDDLDAVHRLLDLEVDLEDALTLAERRQWLQWTVLGYRQLARLHQPPYGDRAIVLRQTGQLIGACGYVPLLNAFGRIPSLLHGDGAQEGLTSPEIGLYWALSPARRGKGYATEAAKGLIDHAFTHLHFARIVATTTHDNDGSLGVMRRIGMRVERNPHADPPWFQAVGVIDRPA